MKTIKVEILTPAGSFASDEAEFVVLPGYSGELGILPGHTRLVAQLVPANIRLVNGKEIKRYATAAGFAVVEPTVIKIFTMTARSVQE